MRIGIVACSSPVGPVELSRGIKVLQSLGFDVVVHPRTFDRDYLFAGRDEVRAQALLDYADDDSIDAIWLARGGYGAGRVVSMIDRLARPAPARRKLLVGYSDVTTLHEYVRTRWNWHTLHAVVPASRVETIPEPVWQETAALVKRSRVPIAWESTRLTPICNPPTQTLRGELFGGNLSLIHTLAGTPYEPEPIGRILFLEDIGEKLYAIDRYVVQMEQAGMFDGLAAVVLGDFTNCEDESNMMLDPKHPDGPLVPQRERYELAEGLRQTFGRVCGERGIPLYSGLPVGHGPNFHPLPLGASYSISPEGRLRLEAWDWLA